MIPLAPSTWHFDLDRYLNPLLPEPPFKWLPYPVSRFLGHRKGRQGPLGNIVIIFWSFVGIFASISVIELVGREIPAFVEHGSPIIVGSFGAAAVLEFYAIESPLAQPRNCVFGQAIASVCGICICKLFLLSDDFTSLRWLAGALACAAATSLMALTGTVHPPAGATALLAVVDDDAVRLGWLLVPVMLLGCMLMLVLALLVNNIQRRFPIYWWTPEETGQRWKRKQTAEHVPPDVEAGRKRSSRDAEVVVSHVEKSQVVIAKGKVTIPDDVSLRPEERLFLEELSLRL